MKFIYYNEFAKAVVDNNYPCAVEYVRYSDIKCIMRDNKKLNIENLRLMDENRALRNKLAELMAASPRTHNDDVEMFHQAEEGGVR